MPTSIHSSFYSLFNERIFFLQQNIIHLPLNCTLVVGLNTDTKFATVTPDSWICTSFPCRFNPRDYRTKTDCRHIVESIIADMNLTIYVDKDIDNLSEELCGLTWTLADLRNWVQAALIKKHNLKDYVLNLNEIQQAIFDDVSTSFNFLSYRGASISKEDLSLWISQFPEELRITARHMAHEAATTYFFSLERCYEAFNSFSKTLEISNRELVTFCRLDQLGKSGPHIAHNLKNAMRWNLTDELDCRLTFDNWPDFEGKTINHIVIADDFVGSGRTIENDLLKPQKIDNSTTKPTISVILEKYKHAKISIIIICGLKSGLQKISNLLQVYTNSRAKIYCFHIIDNKDRCLHEDSIVISCHEQREAMRDFLIKSAKNSLKINKKFWLGYDNAQVLVVFYNTVPNNTIPHIWYDSDKSKWRPLFPASGFLNSNSTLLDEPETMNMTKFNKFKLTIMFKFKFLIKKFFNKIGISTT